MYMNINMHAKSEHKAVKSQTEDTTSRTNCFIEHFNISHLHTEHSLNFSNKVCTSSVMILQVPIQQYNNIGQ